MENVRLGKTLAAAVALCAASAVARTHNHDAECRATGVWYAVNASNVAHPESITVVANVDGVLRATASSKRFSNVSVRVKPDGALGLDCCSVRGQSGQFAGPATSPCSVIEWDVDDSKLYWVLAQPAAPAVVPTKLASSARTAAIDRRAVVSRYPLLTTVADGTALDPADVFTLGNGDFGEEK